MEYIIEKFANFRKYLKPYDADYDTQDINDRK